MAVLRRNSAEDVVRQLADLGVPLFAFIGDAAHRGFDRADLVFGEVAHADGFAPHLSPEMVIRGMGRQPVEPGLKDLGRAELRQRLMQPNEYVLRHVFDLFPPTDDSEQRSEHSPLVAEDDLVESGLISVLRGSNQSCGFSHGSGGLLLRP